VVTVLIESVGWRAAWLVLAVVLAVVVVVIADVIMIRNRPEEMGLLPDGDLAPPERDLGGEAVPAKVEGWPTGAALRLPVTWLLAIFASSSFFALGAMVAHQVAYVRDLGYSPVAAALTMSVASGVGIIGRVGCGVLALRIDIKRLSITAVLFQLVSLIILLTLKELHYIYLFAVLYGIGNGMLITAVPTIVGEYFGRAYFAQIIGIVFAAGIAIEAAAPFVAGLLYDATSSYFMAFLIVAAFSLLGLICIVVSRKPRFYRG
jgi:cyanate permease